MTDVERGTTWALLNNISRQGIDIEFEMLSLSWLF
jgi:hypothetical protein